MELVPNKLHLTIIVYLHPDDIDNYLKAYNKHLSKTDLIFLINSRTPGITDEILKFNNTLYQFNNLSWNTEYSIYRHIKDYIDNSIFMSEYRSAMNIYMDYRKLYKLIHKEMYFTGSWVNLLKYIMDNDVMDQPFVSFRSDFDMYKLMDTLNKYKLIYEREGGYCRETADELSNGNILIEKELKWLYNKYGDKGYFTVLIDKPELLRWFLGLNVTSEYSNTRGPIFIDVLEYLEDQLTDVEDFGELMSILYDREADISEIYSIDKAHSQITDNYVKRFSKYRIEFPEIRDIDEYFTSACINYDIDRVDAIDPLEYIKNNKPMFGPRYSSRSITELVLYYIVILDNPLIITYFKDNQLYLMSVIDNTVVGVHKDYVDYQILLHHINEYINDRLK